MPENDSDISFECNTSKGSVHVAHAHHQHHCILLTMHALPLLLHLLLVPLVLLWLQECSQLLIHLCSSCLFLRRRGRRGGTGGRGRWRGRRRRAACLRLHRRSATSSIAAVIVTVLLTSLQNYIHPLSDLATVHLQPFNPLTMLLVNLLSCCKIQSTAGFWS